MKEDEFQKVRRHLVSTWLLTLGTPVSIPLIIMTSSIQMEPVFIKYLLIFSGPLTYALCRKIFRYEPRAYTWRYRQYKAKRNWQP